MADRTRELMQRWEGTRAKGRWRYVLVQGVLAWGLPMFLVMTFLVNRGQGRTITTSVILISAVMWGIGGMLFGLTMWWINEKGYKKYLESEKE